MGGGGGWGGAILESGCGAGRYVKYLTDKGWDVIGLEFSQETVNMVKAKWPELKIVQGDAANSPFPADYFSGVISLGVVEHFIDGLEAPLNDIYRILKPGGRAFISIPYLNSIRKIKNTFYWYEIFGMPRAIIKRMIRGCPLTINRFNLMYRYRVHPAYGTFFEYRLDKEQFLKAIHDTGFKVIKYIPIGYMDGIYHELNPLKLLIRFKDWHFYPTWFGNIINNVLSKYPFIHSHMQAVIVEK